MIVGHLDPFYAECWAYGRIAETNIKRPVAVPCYGFLAIPAVQENFLSATFGISDWDWPEEEYDRSITDRQSFRAVVKELVTDLVPFSKNMVRGMLADLRSLRNMTVFARDIRADNYRGGKLVDFSVSWTAPYLMLAYALRDRVFIEEDVFKELFEFNKIIEDTGIVTPVRATRNKVYASKLRPRKKIKYQYSINNNNSSRPQLAGPAFIAAARHIQDCVTKTTCSRQGHLKKMFFKNVIPRTLNKRLENSHS